MELQVMGGTFPLLSLLVAVPAVAAVLIWVAPGFRERGHTVALIVSGVELAAFLAVAVSFDWTKAGAYQFAESSSWITPLGVSWSLAVNGLGLAMLLLSAALVPIVLVATRKEDANSEGGYAGLILALYAFIIVIFSAFDVVVFYLAFEAMLVPLYFMIGRYGTGENARPAAMKFLIYSLVGGLAMLGGLVSIYATAGSGMQGVLFRYDTLAALLPQAVFGLQMTVFVTFFIAFAIKAPLVPVHTWLPDTAAAARPGTSVLLVGILDKIGTFGMIILCLQFVPAAAYSARWTILVLAVVSVIWGGFAANGQRDLLRLVSFTSVSHFGFMVIGIFIGTQLALTGAMFFMVAHGVSVAALFLISGFLIERGGSQEISYYGGMQRVTPVLAGTWLTAGLATIALPGLSGFVPEYLVLMGTYEVSPTVALFAVTGVILAALYILLPYQRMFTGKAKKYLEDIPDLDRQQKMVISPLIAGMVVLGIWSAPLIGAFDQISQLTAMGDQQVAVTETEPVVEMLIEGEGN